MPGQSRWQKRHSCGGCGTRQLGVDPVQQFAKLLSKNLTYTLFDIWIRSKTFNVTLWGMLHQDTAHWMHNKWLIDRWTSI